MKTQGTSLTGYGIYRKNAVFHTYSVETAQFGAHATALAKLLIYGGDLPSLKLVGLKHLGRQHQLQV
jgi:hypothetical protein